MDVKKQRKRIPLTKTVTVKIDDPQEFKVNKASDNARRINHKLEQLQIELWYDKHYCDRHQHGDDNGKRNGIDHDIVEALVFASIKHLLFYASVVPGFIFLNPKDTNRKIRVVCQRVIDGNMLNVVIEAHYNSLRDYEVTVKTAMSTEDFFLSDGQYAVELLENDDNSVLKFKRNNKVSDILEV